jgi:hypothetical protein
MENVKSVVMINFRDLFMDNIVMIDRI